MKQKQIENLIVFFWNYEPRDMKTKISKRKITEPSISNKETKAISNKPASQDDQSFLISYKKDDQVPLKKVLHSRNQELIKQDEPRNKNIDQKSKEEQFASNTNDNDGPTKTKKVLRTSNQWREFIVHHDKFDHKVSMRNVDHRFYSLPQESKVKGDILYQKASYLRNQTPSHTNCSAKSTLNTVPKNQLENDFENDVETPHIENIAKDKNDANLVKEVLKLIVENNARSYTAPFGTKSGIFWSTQLDRKQCYHIIVLITCILFEWVIFDRDSLKY